MERTPTLRELREGLSLDQRRRALSFAQELGCKLLEASLDCGNAPVEIRLGMAALAIRIVEELLG